MDGRRGVAAGNGARQRQTAAAATATANNGGDGGGWWWWRVVVMAVAKRRIVGWAILRKQEPDLSLAAFEWGRGQRRRRGLGCRGGPPTDGARARGAIAAMGQRAAVPCDVGCRRSAPLSQCQLVPELNRLQNQHCQKILISPSTLVKSFGNKTFNVLQLHI